MSDKGIGSPAIRAFLDRPRFAVVATVDPDGAPFAAVAWYAVEGEKILVNSAEGRRWPANLRRDPRISLTVEEGYDYVQVIGRVEIVDEEERAQSSMAAIAARYITKPEILAQRIADFRTQRRVLFVITPERVLAHGKPAERRAAERS
ncbi:MAG: hypothetical protein RLZZ432_141 [Chloroflexota bacterium]|jgi:PPOX class probable F420-dependent enzyme